MVYRQPTSRRSMQRIPGNRMQFGYDAITDKGRRQPAKTRTYSADFDLPPKKRSKLVATARDQFNNLSLAAWAIRRHVSYVSLFHPNVDTGSPELDIELKKRLKLAMSADEFDIGGRHSLRDAMKLYELGKVVDGRSFMAWVQAEYKDRNSTHFAQLLESDLIAKPKDNLPESIKDRVTDHGLVMDQYGYVTDFVTCRWNEQGKTIEYNQTIPRADMIGRGGYYGRASQTAGVSPLSAALNAFRDVYEASEWTLLKIKTMALFGVAFERDAEANGVTTASYQDPDTDSEGESGPESRHVLDIKDGVMTFDLDEGEKVNAIESNTPNGNVGDYQNLVIRIALLALDIPYTAYDGRGASFSHTQADREDYEKSAANKREDNLETLQRWCSRKMQLIYDEGGTLADLADAAGLDAMGLCDSVEWMPDGKPWIDRAKEITADEKAVSLGTDSRTRQCKRRGQDFRVIAKELGEEQKLLDELGVTYGVGAPGQNTGNEQPPPVDPNEQTPNPDQTEES